MTVDENPMTTQVRQMLQMVSDEDLEAIDELLTEEIARRVNSPKSDPESVA